MNDIKKISTVPKPLIQKSLTLKAPTIPNLQDSYLIPSERSENNFTGIERRSVSDAAAQIEIADLRSIQDVEGLKKRLGIERYSIEERVHFYMDRIQKESRVENNKNTIANLNGLIAYEINGLSLQGIYELLPLLARAGIERLKQMRDHTGAFPGLGLNSRIFKLLTAITVYENQPYPSTPLQLEYPLSADRSIASVDVAEQLERETLIVMWNRSKFLARKYSIITIAQEEGLFRAPKGAYAGHPDRDPFPNTNANPELARLVWDELRYEGSCASINIWDNAIFSWGRGFAGKGGGLLSLLNNLYADPHFRRLFRAVGIDASNRNLLSILTTDGWMSAPPSSQEIWNQIKNNKSLILFFIALGEIKNMPLRLSATPEYYLQTNSDLQFAEVVKANGIFTVPTSQLEQWKADFDYNQTTKTWPNTDREKDYKQFIQLNTHIFHWLPAFGKNGPLNILKDSNGQFYRASIRNTLLQFADRAAADPINQVWTDVGLLNSNEQEKIFYNSLLQTKPISFQALIMDTGHFMSFGGDWGKTGRVNSPVEKDIIRGLADGSVIEFDRIELIAPGQRHLGYQIYTHQLDGSLAVLKLNQKRFQGSAIYYIFEKNVVKKGYVITRP